MKKMRGFFDPYTLGFIITIIGGAIVYDVEIADKDESTMTQEASNKQVPESHYSVFEDD